MISLHHLLQSRLFSYNVDVLIFRFRFESFVLISQLFLNSHREIQLVCILQMAEMVIEDIIVHILCKSRVVLGSWDNSNLLSVGEIFIERTKECNKY